MATYYFFSVVSSFLLTVNSWLFWPAAVVLVASLRKDPREVYFLAFSTGLLVDVLTGRTLGISAVFLLLLGAAVYLYKTKFALGWLAIFVMFCLSQVVAKLL